MGCDEMVKRIQCRVISSVPLPTYRDTLHCPRSSNDKPDRIDEIVADDIRVNSVSRVGWLNIAVVPVDDAPEGRIFDCYA
jgi:hypothetical protein